MWGIGGCSEPPPDGRDVFLTVGCTRCHGTRGEGASQGPMLEELQSKFTPDQLAEFLDNPPAYQAKDARLQKWREEYFTPMPKLEMTDGQRKALTTYLLETYP